MDLSPAHIHLMLNHIPVLGPWFLALLIGIGLVRRSDELLRTGLLLVVLFAVVSGGVYLTGDPAEHQLEEEAWFDEEIVHQHEERAEVGLVVVLLTGVVALAGLIRARRPRPVGRGMASLVLAAVLLCGGLFAWTALAGGEIRHEEIRHPGSVTV